MRIRFFARTNDHRIIDISIALEPTFPRRLIICTSGGRGTRNKNMQEISSRSSIDMERGDDTLIRK